MHYLMIHKDADSREGDYNSGGGGLPRWHDSEGAESHWHRSYSLLRVFVRQLIHFDDEVNSGVLRARLLTEPNSGVILILNRT